MEKTQWPFNKNNIKPNKVFNDLIAYHSRETFFSENLNLNLINENSGLQSNNRQSKAGFERKGSH